MSASGRRRLNLLFVCSKNRWRSPTAEKIYAHDPRVNVRSRGTTRDAQRTIGSTDLQWADLVMVMEHKHKQRLLADFPGAMQFKAVHVLDIPDDYQFMDPELVTMIEDAVEPVLAENIGSEIDQRSTN